MPHQDDTQYFSQRVEQIRTMAEQAADPGIRSIHAELARLYAKRAQTAQTGG